LRDALLICGSIALLAWLYLVFFHGRFWRTDLLLAESEPIGQPTGLIAVVIPARNEVENIGCAVTSLLNQTCSDCIRIFVVDDNSNDGTAQAARAAAGNDDKLQILIGEPLPPGWTGKLWAAHQGIQDALSLNPRFLLLTDADIEHARASVATLVSIAENENYDLASFMVKLHCQTMAEKLLVPAFVFFFFMLYPPLWVQSSSRRIAGAAGGCMLLRPEALQRAGGIAAIRGAIIDDCALARRVKQSGGRVWLGLTRDTRSLRKYESFGEIERMIARTAFNQLNHSVVLLVAAMFGMALIYLLPVALLFSGNATIETLGAAICLLMLLAYLSMVRFYGLQWYWALTLPVSATFYIFATIDSALRFWSGRGGEWKGRAQDQATPQ
jgi:hopene-associated glycosyltransferase HpnB